MDENTKIPKIFLIGVQNLFDKRLRFKIQNGDHLFEDPRSFSGLLRGTSGYCYSDRPNPSLRFFPIPKRHPCGFRIITNTDRFYILSEDKLSNPATEVATGLELPVNYLGLAGCFTLSGLHRATFSSACYQTE